MASQQWQTANEGLSTRAIEILHLLAEGLSDREIAERLIMTINTVKWYNRQIYSTLNVGSRTQAIARARELHLLHEGERERPTPTNEPPTKHNLPVSTTRFIGRKDELATLKRLLTTTSLLTLVGPPGIGKTRLSLQVAWEVADTFADGCYFVSLAPLSDPARVAHAIASTIGVNEVPGQPLIATLQRVLRARHMLLVLDNFEHLLAAAPLVSELLAAAPHLKVLATSRERLHLYGEQEYAVPPLALPDPEHVDPQTLATCESAALFLQQARAVRADFELTAENTLDIAKICVRLEGLPLAIELAAARSKLLSPQNLLSRLTSMLDTLKGGAQNLPARQQTLYNTISWSYNLLNVEEQKLFARLAVFRGSCSLDAISAVCGPDLELDLWDALESLVNKSLIQQKEQPGGELRFTMLEMLHEYAWVQLAASGEVSMMRRRHAEYFVELAERAAPELRQAQQHHWFRLLETEHENLRTVLQWSLDDGDVTLGVRLGGALCLHWFARGHHVEGRQWTEKLLARLGEVPLRYHAKLLSSAGHIAWLYDLEVARQLFARALQISRDLDDQENIAWSLIFLAYAMMREKESALALVEEGLALFREMNHLPGIAQSLNIIGEISNFSGDNERALWAYEECLKVSQVTGETRRIRFMYGNLTFLAQRQGDYVRARQLAEKGLELALTMDSQLDIVDCLATLAGVIGVTGQPEKAAQLLGAWEAALERMGATVQPADQPHHDRNIAAVRAQLDPQVFDEAWRAGRAMSLAQAVASVSPQGVPKHIATIGQASQSS